MFARFATKALFATAALAASAAVVTPAMAEIGREYRTAVVSYADLDLTSDSGVAILKGRIKVAAREVCGITDNVNLRETLNVNRCRDSAIANAGRAMVTVIAAAQRGERYASLGGGTIAVSGR